MYEKCSVTELHEYFELQTLEERRFSQLLCHAFKISKTVGNIIPGDERRMRGDHKVKIPVHNFKYKTLSKCPLHRVVWEWDGQKVDEQMVDNIRE